jgi:hypothetical protein
VPEAVAQLRSASGGKRVILVPRVFSGRECYSTTVSIAIEAAKSSSCPPARFDWIITTQH